jgi:hypothetical protein
MTVFSNTLQEGDIQLKLFYFNTLYSKLTQQQSQLDDQSAGNKSPTRVGGGGDGAPTGLKGNTNKQLGYEVYTLLTMFRICIAVVLATAIQQTQTHWI